MILINNVWKEFCIFAAESEGEILGSEGNLCLYPEIRNLENFGNGCMVRISQPNLYSISFLLIHIG